jgi:predicted permease
MNNDIFFEFSSVSLPILMLIATGYLARRLLVQDSKAWAALDKVNFRILIPALIIGTIARTDIYSISGFRIGAAIVLVLIILSLILSIVYRISVPSVMHASTFSSVFQTATRWNASIALVVAGLIFDPISITIIGLIMVVLMPIVNAVNIAMMVRLLGEQNASMVETLVRVAQNPIILGCLIGIFLSASSVPLPSAVNESLNILGMASIGTILLSLGAGLSFNGFQGRLMPIALSCILKLFVMPGLVFAVCSLLGLEASVLMIATIATAMPTATNGYVVAQEMGGDAPLYASCCTVQTLLSLVTVPLWILACLQIPSISG